MPSVACSSKRLADDYRPLTAWTDSNSFKINWPKTPAAPSTERRAGSMFCPILPPLCHPDFLSPPFPSMAQPQPSSSHSSSGSSSPSSRPSTSGSSEDAHRDRANFFIPDRPDPPTPHDVARDPFNTPDASLPSTPKPASVVSFSGFADHGLYKRHDSRVSVQSALRKSTTDIQEVGGSSSPGSSRSHARNSFMPPRPLRQSTALSSKAVPRLSTLSRVKKRMRSTMLTGPIEKPWLAAKEPRMAVAHWLVYFIAFLGVAAAAVRVFFAWKTTLRLGNLCPVMEDHFDTFDTENTWTHEVSLSGFG